MGDEQGFKITVGKYLDHDLKQKKLNNKRRSQGVMTLTISKYYIKLYIYYIRDE